MVYKRILFVTIATLLGINYSGLAQDFIFTSLKAKQGAAKVFKAEVDEQRLLNNISAGSNLRFDFEGEIHDQSVKQIRNLSLGYKGITARSSDRQYSSSELMIKDGAITGFLHFEGKRYRLDSRNGDFRLFEVQAKELRCTAEEFSGNRARHKTSQEKAGGLSNSPQNNLENFSDTTTVDVLILYTTSAKNWAANDGSVTDINEILALNESRMNDVLANSQLPLKIRFVKYLEIDDPTASSSTEVLVNMSNNDYTGSTHSSDTVDIHKLRDQYGADVVSLLDEINDTGGIGYMPTGLGGAAPYGYNVNRVQQLSYGFTLIHEIGHNFGNAHGRTQESSPASHAGGMFGYSTGHLMTTPTDSFVTVMHYEDLEGSNRATRVPYFSNPRVNFDPAGENLPTGSYEGEGGPSDNVLSMNITKNWIADYKPTVVDPPVLSMSATTIDETVYPSGYVEKELIIENTGNSDLEIKLDGRMDYSSSSKRAKTIKQPLNIFYGFEESEGYETGSYSSYKNWTMGTVENAVPEFEISSDRAFSGNQSLKVSMADNPTLKSPYFSNFSRYSNYTISFKYYYVNDAGAEFRIVSKDRESAGVSIDEGYIYLYDNSFGGFGSYVDYLSSNTWHDVEIQVEAKNNEEATYTFNENSSFTRPAGSYYPERLEIVPVYYFDDYYVWIDDIQITADDRYGPALSIHDHRKTIRPGDRDTLRISFYGNGYQEGDYTGNVYLETNDPNNDSLSIPVNLSIDPNNQNANDQYAIELTGEEGYRLLSVPADVNLKSFLEPLHTQGMANADAMAGSPNVWTWDESYAGTAITGWNAVSDIDTTISAGESFLVYVFNESEYGDRSSRGFPKLLTAAGASGNTASPSVNQNADGLTLVGNPFPSTIDWDEVFSNSGSRELAGSIYAYDPSKGWKSYSSGSGAGDLTNGLLKPFQGFFIQSASSISEGPALSFETDAITTGGTFYGKSKDQNMIRFEVRDSAGTTSNSSFVAFRKHASASKDNFDALELPPLRNQHVAVFTQSEDHIPLDINVLPSFEKTVEVPLSVQSDFTSSVSFILTNKQGLEEVDIYITNGEWRKQVKLNEAVQLSAEITSLAKSTKKQPAGRLENKRSQYSLVLVPKSVVSNEGSGNIPQEFEVHQNYPNPFNPITTIPFGLPTDASVKISVYNVLGQLVDVLVDQPMQAGYHTVTFDVEHLSSGIYLFRLEAEDFVQTQKMILMK